jgi:hypothetical protein
MTLDSRIVRWIRRRLIPSIEIWLDARYCVTCDHRDVLYNDGSRDCPDLSAEEKQRKGGEAKG